MHDSGHSYIIAIHNIYTLSFRIWRVVILLMRAKCVGPARVNKKAYCIYIIYARCALYAICTLYIAHTAHLFLHTFCIYNEV